jgi:hypothetical protein
MASYSGPSLPSGLVTCIDVSNQKGYSGSTVINLADGTLNFSGNSGYINSTRITSGSPFVTSSTSILDTDTHSIFFKIKFNTSGTYPSGTSGNWEKIFSFNAPGSDRSPSIWRWPSERTLHWRYDPSNSGCDFGKTAGGTGNPFDLDTWYFVGVTKNGGSTAMYVNGVQVGTGSVSSPKTPGSAAIQIFQSYGGASADFNNLYIFNRTLSSTEVSELFRIIRPQLGI